MISAYIALRFEWKYAVPVLIALMHDLLITAGVYALTGREVTTSTVAALLTILGYSLYDTIIVFDRMRENVPRMPRAAFSQIVNRSMSEVLTRSLATSFCTLLPILALLLFGGETLKDFAFALLVGVALGRVLVDLHRLAGAHALEGARGASTSAAGRASPSSSAAIVPAYAVADGRRAGRRRAAEDERRAPPDHRARDARTAACRAAASSTRWCATCTSTRRRRDGHGRASASATRRRDADPRGPRAQGRQAEARQAEATAQQAPREAR